jgi:hypothetical protein
MDLLLTEKQLKLILSKEVTEQGETTDAAGSPEAAASAAPESGTSSGSTGGGQGYPTVDKWESGVSRGPANQVDVTKWEDVVGSSLKRGKGNPLN